MSRRPKLQRDGSRSLSIREKAYLHIQQQVAQGHMPPGSAVSELVLAKHLGSSRTPIREAMNQLAAEGLLRQAPGGGMVVSQLSREDIVELYAMREALEVYAVGEVASAPLLSRHKLRMQQLIDDVGTLEKELAKSKKAALDTAQMSRFLSADLGFHAFLIGMTNNSRIQKLLNDTRLLISIFAIHRQGHDAQTLKAIRTYHQQILDAVDRQDRAGATQLLASHIRQSREERLGEFDEWRRESSLREAVPTFFDVHGMN